MAVEEALASSECRTYVLATSTDLLCRYASILPPRSTCLLHTYICTSTSCLGRGEGAERRLDGRQMGQSQDGHDGVAVSEAPTRPMLGGRRAQKPHRRSGKTPSIPACSRHIVVDRQPCCFSNQVHTYLSIPDGRSTRTCTLNGLMATMMPLSPRADTDMSCSQRGPGW